MSNNITVKVGDKVKLNQTGIEAGLDDECWYGAGTKEIKILQADPDREWTVCCVDDIDKGFRLVGLGFFYSWQQATSRLLYAFRTFCSQCLFIY